MPSKKVLEQKQEQVKEISEKMKNAKIVLLADYKGITVEDDRVMRKAFRESGYYCSVVKNSIIKLAAKDAGIDGLDDVLQGPTVIVTGDEYTVAPKIMYDFAKTHEFYKIKGGVMDGKIAEVDAITRLAKLPPREVLLTNLASALIGNIRNVAVVLDQVAKKKEEVVSA